MTSALDFIDGIVTLFYETSMYGIDKPAGREAQSMRLEHRVLDARRSTGFRSSLSILVRRTDTNAFVRLGACRSMPIARSKTPVPPNTSLLFGHNATALLPHRASYRRNIRLRIGQLAYSDRLLALVET